MASFTIELSGKCKPPYGRGTKVIQGKASLSPDTEAIRAEDLGLGSIYELIPRQTSRTRMGTILFTQLGGIGSLGGANYASFVALRASYQSGVKGSVTLTDISSTISVSFIAIGE